MDAVDQAINYTFKGGEMTIRLIGSGAKNLILLIAALLKDTQRTKGKTRLARLLKEGKEQAVLTVNKDQIKEFNALAKKYGVLYCAINNPNAQDIDIIIKAEDIPKVKRIYEKLGWGEVDIETKIVSEQTDRVGEQDISVEEPEPSEEDIAKRQAANKATVEPKVKPRVPQMKREGR